LNGVDARSVVEEAETNVVGKSRSSEFDRGFTVREENIGDVVSTSDAHDIAEDIVHNNSLTFDEAESRSENGAGNKAILLQALRVSEEENSDGSSLNKFTKINRSVVDKGIAGKIIRAANANDSSWDIANMNGTVFNDTSGVSKKRGSLHTRAKQQQSNSSETCSQDHE